MISPRLAGPDYDCALAHELNHDELGITTPPATPATMQRIETMVDRDTADWLVPAAALHQFVLRRSTVEPVTAFIVADEFHVTNA